MSGQTYTLKQIKNAFIEQFNEAGELWFPYFHDTPFDEEWKNKRDNLKVTLLEFEEFKERLINGN